MLTSIEYRAFRAETLNLDEAGTAKRIVGYAAVFDKLSEDMWGFREQIARGAFRKTLQEANVRALLEHDPRWLLGSSQSKTLRLVEDDHGLHVEIDPPDTSAGRDVVESLRRGDLSAMSFGFRAIKEKWETKDEKPLRVLQEVALYDVSLVAFPAYPDTSVALRSGYAAGILSEPARCHSDVDKVSRLNATHTDTGRLRRWLRVMEREAE